MDFYLGTHMVNWAPMVDIPLFVSRVRYLDRVSIPEMRAEGVEDGGGYSQLMLHNRWSVSDDVYAEQMRRSSRGLKRVRWMPPRDWMCEPWMVRKTGLTIEEHQRRTVESYCYLIREHSDLPWIPVIQGYYLDDYLRCWEMYDHAGVDLAKCAIVGVGTLCRRQDTKEAEIIINRLFEDGLTMHGFGFKKDGLRRCGAMLKSADSMAWSFGARRQKIRLPGHKHQTCANCLEYATQWYHETLEAISAYVPRARTLAWC